MRSPPSPTLLLISCTPIGCGLACSGEITGPGAAPAGPVRLQTCVGDADRLGLHRHLEAASLIAAPRVPLELWVDTEPSDGDAGPCDVLSLTSGERAHVVAFGGSRPGVAPAELCGWRPHEPTIRQGARSLRGQPAPAPGPGTAA